MNVRLSTGNTYWSCARCPHVGRTSRRGLPWGWAYDALNRPLCRRCRTSNALIAAELASREIAVQREDVRA